MLTREFDANAPGNLVAIGSGMHAFIPHPLPPKYVRSDATNRAAEDAVNAIGELRGMTTGSASFIGTDNFIRPLLGREAVLSSKIEGTVATLQDLFRYEASPNRHNFPDDIQEVVNYGSAVNLGLDAIKDVPQITAHLIRSLHQKLMTDVRGGEAEPGNFRNRQVFIGSPTASELQKARFIPPPPLEVPLLMDSLLQYINGAGQHSRLESIALAHYQFETIHPFLDGNGRIGRLLITLMLGTTGLLSKPLLHLSAFFESDRREYYDRLLGVSQRGDWDGWLRYFFRGAALAASDVQTRIARATAMRAEILNRLRAKSSRLSIAAPDLLDEIFRNPYISVAKAARAIGRTAPATQKLLDLFVSAGIVATASAGQRNRLYVAKDILKIYE